MRRHHGLRCYISDLPPEWHPAHGVANTSAEVRRSVNPRRRVWLVVAVIVVVIGTTASVLGARAVARNDGQKSQQTAVTSSVEVAGTLKVTIQHEQDLAVSAGAFVIGNPTATQAQFQQWTSSVHAFERYPEVVGIAEIVLVPATQLSAFAAHAMADPTGPLAADGTFQVSPAGARPYYCFETLAQAHSGQLVPPAGFDVCDTELGPGLMSARDSGQGTYLPYGTGSSQLLVVGTPIYSGGVVPATVQARRDAFIGWVGTEILPSVILSTALVGQEGIAVAFHYQNGTDSDTFKADSAPAGAQSRMVNLHNGWRVQTFSSVTEGRVLANPNALGSMLGGILVSLLLGVLIYVLGTSRSRAVVLVHERADQLRYQALHD